MKRSIHTISRRGAAAPWIIGCSVALLLAIVVIIAGSIFAVKKGKEVLITTVKDGVTQSIEDSDLDPETQKEVILRVDRIAKEYQEGELTTQQGATILKQLVQGPLIPTLLAHAFTKQYVINNSDLTPEEQQNATLQMQRLLRGVMNNKISQEKMEQALSPVMTEQPDGSYELKPTPTAEEIREVISNAQQVADEAGISNEEYEVDIPAEIDRAIEEAKKKAPAEDAS